MLLSPDMKINLSLFIAFCFIIVLVIHEDHAGVVLKNFKSRQTLIEELKKDSKETKVKKDATVSTKNLSTSKPKVNIKAKGNVKKVAKGSANNVETNFLNISNSSHVNERQVAKFPKNNGNLLSSSVVYVTLNDTISDTGSSKGDLVSNSLKSDSKLHINCSNCSISTIGRSVNGGNNHNHPIRTSINLKSVPSNLSVDIRAENSSENNQVPALSGVTPHNLTVAQTVVLSRAMKNKTENILPVKLEENSSSNQSLIKSNTVKTVPLESSQQPLNSEANSDSSATSILTAGLNSSKPSETFSLTIDPTEKAVLFKDASTSLSENITEALHNLLPSQQPSNKSEVSEKKIGNLSIGGSTKFVGQSKFNFSKNEIKQELNLGQKSEDKISNNTHNVESSDLLKMPNKTSQTPHVENFHTHAFPNRTEDALTRKTSHVNSSIVNFQENNEKSVQSLQIEDHTNKTSNQTETMNGLKEVDNTSFTILHETKENSTQPLQAGNNTKSLPFQQGIEVDKSEMYPNTRNNTLIDGLVNGSTKAIEILSSPSEITSTNIKGMNETDMGLESMVSAGLNFLANSEVAKNAAFAMEIFNLSDSSFADHVIEDSDLHGVIDVMLPSLSTQDELNSDTSEIHSNKTNPNVTGDSDDSKSQNSTSFNNESSIEHVEPTSEEMPLELLPVMASNSTTSEKKCPAPGICVFWFMARDACTSDNQCLGSKRCCRIRCSKQCVDV